MQELFNSIEYLKGVGPKRAELLRKELDVHTFGDLLNYFPFRYIDKTKFYKTNEINSDLPYVQLVGHICRLQEVGAKHSKRLTAKFQDENGAIELIWFKGTKWIKDSIKANKKYVVFGKPNLYNGKINIVHPELESIDENYQTKLNTLQPIYSTTESLSNKGLTNKAIGKLTSVLVPQVINSIKENLSSELIQKLNLIPRREAYTNIHFPTNTKTLQQAQYRLKFEELFFIQLQLIRMKIVRKQKLKGFALSQIGEHFNNFFITTCLLNLQTLKNEF